MDLAAIRAAFDEPAPYDRHRFERLETAVKALLDAHVAPTPAPAADTLPGSSSADAADMATDTLEGPTQA